MRIERLLLAIVAGLAVAGCSFTTGTRRGADGSVLSISNSRWLWSTGQAGFTLEETNGLKMTLSLTRSTTDSAAVAAAAEGAARGAK